MVKIVNGGLKCLAANFFVASQQGTTDVRRGDFSYTMVEDMLPIFSAFVFGASFLSVRFS